MKYKTSLTAIGILALIAVGAIAAQARSRAHMRNNLVLQVVSGAPSVTLRQPQPEVVVKNVATSVKIPALITGDVVSGGVNLLRIGADGKSTILGQLASDPSVGAGGYSVSRSFNEPSTGTITLQLSVAIKGQLKRLTSPTFQLAVSTKTIILPQDPGDAGKSTIAGVDSDHDGVRDDIQRLIVFNYPASERSRTALMELARAMQEEQLAQDRTASIQATKRAIQAQNCFYGVTGLTDNTMKFTSMMSSSLTNTPDRLEAWFKANGNFGGQHIDIPDDPLTQCSFDPNTLPN